MFPLLLVLACSSSPQGASAGEAPSRAVPGREATSSAAPAEATPQAEQGQSPASGEAPVPADVLFVRARRDPDGSWTFAVTVRHPDRGWEDYADGWNVLLPDGTVVDPDPSDPFTRKLWHPHVDEQPFTRSQSGIRIPEGVDEVRVRAHDLLAGWGGREVTVHLDQPRGPDWEILGG